MNTTPIKIRKSKNGWLRTNRGGLTPSLLKVKRENRYGNRRYIFSILLFGFAMTGLVISSVDGFVNEASAQANTRNNYNFSLREWLNGNRNDRDDRRETTNRERDEEQPVAPVQNTTPQPTAPAPAETQPAPTVVTPATTSFAPIVPPIAENPVEVAPNTAPEIAATTSAQAAVESVPVTYTTQQISTDTRNQLLTAAVVAAASGTIIFILSLLSHSLLQRPQL